jgi:hypothetical protein
MDIIYIRGGDKTAPTVANESGMYYGTRHDYQAYADVYMLDIHWQKYDWAQYLRLVADYEPIQAMVADYENENQHVVMLNQCYEIARLGVRPIVCIKFPLAEEDVPDGALIAISVPTSYAGWLPDLKELRGREIHLLGGSPDAQIELITKLNGVGATVVSTDLNYHARKAQMGQYYDGAKWIQTEPHAYTNTQLAIISGQNIVKALNEANKHSQRRLI